MCIPTALVGCLPTYSQVGWLAPLLLVLVRIVQGLALGGACLALAAPEMSTWLCAL
jgi:hypothetical protein